MKIKLKGLKQVQKKLADWEDSRVKALRKSLQQTGKAIRRDARKRVPKGTRTRKVGDMVYRPGNLRRSISYRFKQSKRKGMAVFIRAVAPYSHIVELGSAVRNIPPRPFMQPAFDANEGAYMMKLEYIMGTV
jgi:HK97 gp10 family phage protein